MIIKSRAIGGHHAPKASVPEVKEAPVEKLSKEEKKKIKNVDDEEGEG